MICVMAERDLVWVGDRVVEPIVSSVFTEEERRGLRVSLIWGSELRAGDGGAWEETARRDGTLRWIWVKFKLRPSGEVAQWRLCAAEEIDDLDVVSQAAFDLGGRVEDWFCETSVGWGQQRHAQIPSLIEE